MASEAHSRRCGQHDTSIKGQPCLSAKEMVEQVGERAPMSCGAAVDDDCQGALLLPDPVPPSYAPPSLSSLARSIRCSAADAVSDTTIDHDATLARDMADPEGYAVLARAESAEKQVARLEEEIRRLRHALHILRDAKDKAEERAASMEEVVCSLDSASVLAGKLEADHRISRLEAENVRLHCELEGLRSALLGRDFTEPVRGPAAGAQSELATRVPEARPPADYAFSSCCRYCCSCLYFWFARLCLLLVACLLLPARCCERMAAKPLQLLRPNVVKDISADTISKGGSDST